MACTEVPWACEPSSVAYKQPSYSSTCGSDGLLPCMQIGQSINDVQPSTPSSVEKYHKFARFQSRSWQDSFDFQEFGFSFDVTDVAPADELFYKGQILPLQIDTRFHVVQSLSSCCCMTEELAEVQPVHAGRPSSVKRDEHEVRFTSCRIEGAMCEKASKSNMLGQGMRSLSFQSHHSGYWESSGEKDMTDTSYSSSRDSSGSSQDSYFPSYASIKSHSQFCKAKPSVIPWKSLFGGLMKISRREHNPSSPLPVVAFSEDLSMYRSVADLSFADTKASVPSLMSGKDVDQEKLGVASGKVARDQHMSHGESKGKLAPSDGGEKGTPTSIFALKAGGEISKHNNKSCPQDKELQQSKMTTPHYPKEGLHGTVKVKIPRLSKGRSKSKCTTDTALLKGAKIGVDGHAEGPRQRRNAVKERWQGYARKLKPLYEVKKGLMGQFRMDECAKNACEVESGIVRRPSSWQRKLSHQSSFFKNHKWNMEHEENGACSAACTGSSNHNMQVAMSSCPPSTRSSPNHSGVLLAGVGEGRAKHHQSGGHSSHAAVKKVVNNECMSMSTMHELHSAVQSAIAHCKESNRRTTY